VFRYVKLVYNLFAKLDLAVAAPILICTDISPIYSVIVLAGTMFRKKK
jgi:hypothetical protein